MPAAPPFLSIVIPACNEEGSITDTVEAIIARFAVENCDDYEIVVVDDGSTDGTAHCLEDLEARLPRLRHIYNPPPNGFGLAVRLGLASYRGAAVCIVMADQSDSPDDIWRYCERLRAGAECVFGSRFMRESQVIDYPVCKLVLNRFANLLIRLLFGLRFNDITNAFKGYRRGVIDGLQPLLSRHFSLAVELPLKAIVRGFRYEVLPISWRSRKCGTTKFRIREMGSRYLLIVLCVLIEKWLSRGAHHRAVAPTPPVQ
jgi:dolichol-phosphate mannosyltransferase